MKTFILSGDLIAISPIAVSPPGVAFYGEEDTKKFPKRLPRAGAGYKAERYIPASTLRHVIRHELSVVVLEALKASGKEIPLNALLAFSTGFTQMKKSAKGNKGQAGQSATAATKQDEPPLLAMMPAQKSGDDDQSLDDSHESHTPDQDTQSNKKKTESSKQTRERLAAERRVRERNPLYGMLGAWGLPSELRVGNALPRGEGHDTYALSPGEVHKELTETLVSALTDDDLRQYEALLDEGAKKDKGNTGLKHVGKGWEEIVAGTKCGWNVHIHRATDLKVGAVLAALRRFASEPVIGAHKAVGRGEVALSMSGQFVEQQFLAVPRSTPAGELTLGFGAFTVTGALEACLAAFDEQARAGFPGLYFDDVKIIAQDAEVK